MTNLSGANLNNGSAVGPQGEGRDSPSSFPKYPAYKNSGVEWLGEVPQHWPVYSLKRTVDGCVNGLWGDEPDGENDIAVIRVADFERSFSMVGLDKLTYRSITPKERKSRLIKSGDLLIEKSGGGEKTLVGCVVLFTHEFEAITSNFVARMRPLAEFDSQFLCYAFGNLYHGRVNYPSVKQVTGIQNLDAESYLQERFCFPARVEQTQIARFLDHETARIDALIEEQQRLIELLKEKRQAVISHAVTKGLDPTVPMKDSGVEWLGEVPAHWHVKKLKNVTLQIIDGAHFTPTYVDVGVPFIRVTDIQTQDLDLDSIKRIPESEHHELIKRCNPARGDVLLSKNGTIGITKIVDWDFEFSIFVSLCLIKPAHNISSKYLLNVLSGNYAMEQFKDSGQKTSVTNLHLEKIREIFVVLPSNAEQFRISNFIDQKTAELDLLISEAMLGNSLLQERRSALISAAVTGKIDVRGWQPPASAPTPELVQEAV